MDTFLNILPVLIIGGSGVAALVWLLLGGKGSNTTRGQLMNPLADGPRYRDGAVTYNQFDGRRYHIELEDPRGGRGARYQRRHPSMQRKPPKPWMK